MFLLLKVKPQHKPQKGPQEEFKINSFTDATGDENSWCGCSLIPSRWMSFMQKNVVGTD